MPSGRIKSLIHLSQQTNVPGTRLVAGRNDKGYGINDKGYGIIADDDGREVYFSHEIVEGLHGFDDLRRGQRLDYVLDEPFLRALSVNPAVPLAALALAPAESHHGWSAAN